jgi:hypothetical protein
MAKNQISFVSVDGIGELNRSVRDYINKRATATYKEVEEGVTINVRKKIRTSLSSSNAIKSLLSGKLKSDFGLTDSAATVAVRSIIDHVSDNIKVSIKYSYRGANVAVLSLDLLPLGVDAIAALPAGNYISTGKYGGGDVTWLTWLLTKGTSVIIGDFYVFEGARGRSRSGQSVMQKNVRGGSGFRVDPGFAGSKDDNFITRALTPIIPEIRDEVFKTFIKALEK